MQGARVRKRVARRTVLARIRRGARVFHQLFFCRTVSDQRPIDLAPSLVRNRNRYSLITERWNPYGGRTRTPNSCDKRDASSETRAPSRMRPCVELLVLSTKWAVLYWTNFLVYRASKSINPPSPEWFMSREIHLDIILGKTWEMYHIIRS